VPLTGVINYVFCIYFIMSLMKCCGTYCRLPAKLSGAYSSRWTVVHNSM